MKRKYEKQIALSIVLIVISSIFCIHPSYGVNTTSNAPYQDSVQSQGINLTIGVSSRYLTWDQTLIIQIYLYDLSNNTIPSSNLFLKITTISYVYITYNISLPFTLFTNNFTNINGFKEIYVPILHVPTQQPYILTAIFSNATQTGPNVTYSIDISSIRTSIIPPDLFIWGYIGLLGGFVVLYILFKTDLIKTNSKDLHDPLKRKALIKSR